MGYRSQVALALTNDAKILLRRLCDHDPGLAEILNYADSDPDWDDKDYDCKITWADIKWYEGYEDVDRIEHFMENIDEEDYLFIRLGEDSDDIEYKGQFWESDMYVNRTIEW